MISFNLELVNGYKILQVNNNMLEYKINYKSKKTYAVIVFQDHSLLSLRGDLPKQTTLRTSSCILKVNSQHFETEKLHEYS